jgi:hypothetical protein
LQKLLGANVLLPPFEEMFSSGDATGNYDEALMAKMKTYYCKDPETWDTYRGVRSTTRVTETNASSTSQEGNGGKSR